MSKLTVLEMQTLATKIALKRNGEKEPQQFIDVKVDIYLIRVNIDGCIVYEGNPQNILKDAELYQLN